MKSKLWPLIFLGMFSASCHASYNQFTGYYSGFSVGIADTFGKVDSTSQLLFNNPATGTNDSVRIHSKGSPKIDPQLGIAVGYGCLRNSFYLGGELGGFFSRATIKNEAESFFTLNDPVNSISLSHNSKSKINNWEVALDFTPGFVLFDNYLLFARVGVGYTQIRIDSRADLVFSPGGGVTSSGVLPLVASKSRPVLRLGIGLAHPLSENLVLNANYLYARYGKMTASAVTDSPPINSPGFPPLTNNFSTTSSAKLHRQTFSIGFNYFFSNL